LAYWVTSGGGAPIEGVGVGVSVGVEVGVDVGVSVGVGVGVVATAQAERIKSMATADRAKNSLPR